MESSLKGTFYIEFIVQRVETVAYTYAGILGPLAMLAALMRGFTHGSSAAMVVMTAWICLLVFACIGAVVGALAGWIVEQSVRERVLVELESSESEEHRGQMADGKN
ncbi:MAG: hypothetical protein JXM70_03885 [Pirellulales bacterium]|nr:hypothetical protein [Pirellulales bacterium]